MTDYAITASIADNAIRARGCVQWAAMLALLVFASVGHSPRSVAGEVPPPKGNLFDVAGTPLTVRSAAWGAMVNVKALRALGWEQASAFVQGIATQTAQRPGELQSRIEGARGETVPIASGLTEAQVESTRRWLQASPWSRVKLLSFYPQSRTRYPLGALTVQLVGFESNEDRGEGQAQEGMLLAMDSALWSGSDVRLTIDAKLQRMVRDELAAPLVRLQARSASAVVIELPTGNVVALVSLPTWDPNRRDRYDPRLQRLRPVTDIFQPGPMLQPFLIAGLRARRLSTEALEQQFIAGRDIAGRDIAGRDIAGPTMVRTLGVEGTIAVLNQLGFTRGATTSSGFPGEGQTIGARLLAVNADRRVAVMNRYFIDEVGSGRGVASSLLFYASSLADLISGSPMRTTTLISTVTDRQGKILHPHEKTTRSPGFPQVGNEVRELLVRRARQVAGNDAADDIGGLWASYDQQLGNGKQRQITCALFTPAQAPRYLVVLNISDGRETTYGGGFDIGQAILQRLRESAGLAVHTSKRS